MSYIIEASKGKAKSLLETNSKNSVPVAFGTRGEGEFLVGKFRKRIKKYKKYKGIKLKLRRLR